MAPSTKFLTVPDDEALPAFLTEDGDEDDATEADEEEPSMIAAE